MQGLSEAVVCAVLVQKAFGGGLGLDGEIDGEIGDECVMYTARKDKRKVGEEAWSVMQV